MSPNAEGLVVRSGTRADYDAMSRFHYRGERPATSVRILVAECGEQRIGVLVVSMPAINGPWRETAWPGCYGPGENSRVCLRRVNAEIRVISRVIVEPRWRARGVARLLVEAYLRDPLTIRTEAIAAMGRICPFFERAGMRAVKYAPARRTERLRRKLARLGIEPWRLADVDAIVDGCEGERRRVLGRALRTFASAHRDTRHLAGALLPELVTAAARRVACEPVAYVFEADRSARWRNSTAEGGRP